jgi:hypothetical protein
MIGSLVLASFFFLTYKGHDVWDNILTSISSISAIGIVVFPMYGPFDKVGLFMVPNDTSHILHCIMAAVLFVSFALMILTQFTKGKDKKRNIVYYVCGSAIVVFMVNEVLAYIVPYAEYWTIINEFFMLEAFAVAWIVKSRVTFTKQGS